MRKKSRNTKLKPADLVLWSDESLLVVDKPAGVLTIPGGYEPGPDLVHLLEPAFSPLWVVHRLDRDTSGVIVLARTSEVHQALNAQSHRHTVIKVYHALVQGDPQWTERTVELPLRADGDRQHRTVVAHAVAGPHRGKPSVTECRVLERFGPYALMEAIPRTGRTHQIRAHLSALGLPIVADALYGGGSGLFLSAIKPGYRRAPGPERPLLARMGLHAHVLTLEHPLTQETLRFEAPYPRDFSAALRQLRRIRTAR